MNDYTILMIDDDKDFLRAIQAILDQEGYKISTAYDGETGMKKAVSLQPDLIILDVMLPKKDGYSICHQLKHQPQTSHIPILIVTSLDSELIAKGHNADGYFEKPVESQVLLEKVHQLITDSKSEKKEKKSKILLIDDDPDFIGAVKIVLDENGYDVIVAYTGEDGIKKAMVENPDLVLLDVMLPQIDGYEVCHTLKDDDKTKLIPVIMLTSVSRKLTKPEYAQVLSVTHHADDHLEKPVEAKDLLNTIRKFIGPMRRLV